MTAARAAIRAVFLSALLGAAAAGCAPAPGAGGAESYSQPNWSREKCWQTNWRLQGAWDAGRYADGEKRLAALVANCAQHGKVDAAAWREGFASGS